MAMKNCNLVCRAWYAQLHPRLMASVVVSPLILKIIKKNPRAFSPVYHMVKKLTFMEVGAKRGLPISSRAPFSHLTHVSFHRVKFKTFGDIIQSINSVDAHPVCLTVLDCTFKDSWIIRDAIAQKRTASLHLPPYTLGLSQIDVDSDHIDYISLCVLSWVASNHTNLSALRSLRIRFENYNNDSITSLFAFVSQPDCLLEELRVIYGSGISDAGKCHLVSHPRGLIIPKTLFCHLGPSSVFTSHRSAMLSVAFYSPTSRKFFCPPSNVCICK
jgi:hypothetical protein